MYFAKTLSISLEKCWMINLQADQVDWFKIGGATVSTNFENSVLKNKNAILLLLTRSGVLQIHSSKIVPSLSTVNYN